MPVVIKMMRHDMTLYPEFLESFHNEAKTIAGLCHEHIVKVYDFEERYKTLFIIMEYLKGDSLKDMIRHLRVIPPKLAVNFLAQICSALAYAHDRGIIHRDINPSNIIVQPSDRVKILDFGLACPSGTEDFSNKGTPYYMAPEQIDGAPVDPRTDIYALGITAFEMITGRRPFPEDNVKELFDCHLTRDVMDPLEFNPAIPRPLQQFILKCARCDPNQRYQDMNQARAALKPLMQDFRMPGDNLSAEKSKRSSLLLTYTDKNQAELTRLVEAFQAKARELGAEVDVADSQDL